VELLQAVRAPGQRRGGPVVIAANVPVATIAMTPYAVGRVRSGIAE
jgi:hypothetical protein